MHSKLKNVHLIFIFKRRQKWVIYVFILLQVLEKHDHQLEGVYLAQGLYTKFVIMLLGSWHSPIVGSTIRGKKF